MELGGGRNVFRMKKLFSTTLTSDHKVLILRVEEQVEGQGDLILSFPRYCTRLIGLRFATALKVAVPTKDSEMANSKVDRNVSIMETEFGTRCLITDTAADYYLDKSRRRKEYTIPEDSYSRWCGGADGFDLFTERFNE